MKKTIYDSLYVTLRVSRKLTKKELAHIAQIDDPVFRKLEQQRHTLLFTISVRADDEKTAIRSVKRMLKSELVIEKDNGKRSSVHQIER